MDTIAIKGTSDGLVITFGEGSLQTILDEMESQLSSKASFFLGGRAALRVGERPLSAEQLKTIGNLLELSGMTLWAVEGEHPSTLVAAQELGLETSMRSKEPPVSTTKAEQKGLDESGGLIVQQTLRSGQAIRHAGHVCVIGDANPGSEIVAGGNIIVWGRLRGIAHAGAMGDDEAIICALQLMPSQIRIGAHIARPPDRGRAPKTPEVASVQKDQIVVERWDKKR
jgi:septum site-determining protein MinC